MAFNLHNIDPDSDQFYIIARDYSICPEVETISKIHKIPIKKVMALLDDTDFTDLVATFRKQATDKGKNPLKQYIDGKAFYFIKRLEDIGSNDDHPKVVDAITKFLTISGELQKTSQAQANKNAKSGSNVKIEVKKVEAFNPDWEEEDDTEEDDE